MRERKKLRDTKVGAWLKSKAPQVLEVIGEVVPDAGAFSLIRKLAFNDPSLSSQDKIELESVIQEEEVDFQQEVTERWKADMESDSYLAKNVRPMMLIALVVFYMALTIWDGISQRFMPPQNYIDLLELLMLTAFGAYFAGRSVEKTFKK